MVATPSLANTGAARMQGYYCAALYYCAATNNGVHYDATMLGLQAAPFLVDAATFRCSEPPPDLLNFEFLTIDKLSKFLFKVFRLFG